MKIMHILNTGGYSGAENIVISIIKKMNNLHNKSVYVSPAGIIEKKLKEENIEYFELKKMTVKNLKSLIKEINPDIIHAHDFNASIMVSLTGTKKCIISHIHNNSPWIRKYGIKSIVYLLSSIKYSKILIVSESIQKEYVFSKFIKRKIVLIKNFVDEVLVRKRAQEAKEIKEYDVIFLGRLVEPKDPIRFIKIVEMLKKEKTNISVAMVGEGHLRHQIELEIKNRKLQNNIHMLGFCDNPYPILNKSKILCMTSQYEGYGLVAVEAMILNKPVVATDVGGIPSIVDDSWGKICKEDKDFILEISQLLNDESYYKQKIDNINSKLNKINNTSKYIEELNEIYKLILK